MFNRSQYIYIGLSVIKIAFKSKRQAEALAFAFAIKTKFRNSTYKNPNHIEVAKLMQISTKKAKQIMEDSISYGYVRIVDKHYVANKLKVDGEYNYKFERNKIRQKEINTAYVKKSDTQQECISLEYILMELRSVLMSAKINSCQFIDDTIHGVTVSKNIAEIKRCKKVIEKYDVNVEQTKIGTCSMETVMETVETKNRNKAQTIILFMISQGYITKKKNIVKIKETNIKQNFKSNEFGAFFTWKNNLYQVYNNSYILNNEIKNNFVLR